MAVTLGLKSALAIAKEVTFGTPVTTTRGLPVISESLTMDPGRVRTNSVKGGGLLPPDTTIRNGPIMGQGSIQTYLFVDGATLLWEAMTFGAPSTSAGPPYTHTYNLGDTPPSYSVQVGYGATSTTKVKKVEGLVVSSWELAVSQGAEPITLGMDCVYENEDVVASGETDDDVAGTFATSQPFYLATEIAGTVDTGGGATSYCVQSLRLRGENNLKVEHCLGTRYITAPTRNGRPAITGELTMKLDDTSNALYDAFLANTISDIVLTATQGSNTCIVTMTAHIDGTSPQLSGHEELMVTYPFTVVVDDSNSETDTDAFQVDVTNDDATP